MVPVIFLFLTLLEVQICVSIFRKAVLLLFYNQKPEIALSFTNKSSRAYCDNLLILAILFLAKCKKLNKWTEMARLFLKFMQDKTQSTSFLLFGLAFSKTSMGKEKKNKRAYNGHSLQSRRNKEP